MRTLIWAANLLGWPVIHLGVAKIILSIPLERFANNKTPYAIRRWERDGDIYREYLGIRRWKSLLPDGAPWLGGFSKKRLASRNQQYLQVFIRETRRAEFAHWCMLLCFPVFFLWNPPWACWVMAGYAVAANLPCIVAQRYNRLALQRLLDRLQSPSPLVIEIHPDRNSRVNAD